MLLARRKFRARHAQETERIETEAKNRTEMFEQNWRVALEEAAAEREVSARENRREVAARL
jgi:hypothetical protein